MRVGIVGAGSVGSAVAKLAAEYGHTVTALTDSQSAVVDERGIDVTAVLDEKRRDGVVGNRDVNEALDGPYDALVETTPTTTGDAEPAFEHVRTALERDRHVVLGNKGPMAERYADVRALERESAGTVRFEATVGGVMPVLSTIHDVGPGQITGVRGVFNGFVNFILSRMAAEGLGYEHVLAEARDLQIVEENPTLETEGIDTALSCSTVANVLAQRGREYTLDDVEVEGISEVRGSALELAKEDGRTVRLVGEVVGDRVRVGPRLVSATDALAVSGTQTVVQLETEHAGLVNVTGGGKTASEVATAILADVTRLNSRR